MNFSLKYAENTQEISIPDKNLLQILNPNPVKKALTGADEVRRSLKEPIGSRPLKELVRPGETVAIVTSDITRPMPSRIVLPEVLQELLSGGVKPEDITIIFALGSHRPHTEEEKRRLAGDAVYETYACIDSDPSDCTHLGHTANGTPIDIFSPVVKADRRICLGNIEYHYFAGYSGGIKAIMPGASTPQAIQTNHAGMIKELAVAGNLEGNPVRNDLEEVGHILPVDFLVNVVLDEQKQIIRCVAGHWIDAHREGCRFLDTLYKVEASEKADIVLVSAGGYPKDINLYQAQKALDNAKHAVKDGGIIILAASCREGLGNACFERWMTEADSPQALVDRIGQKFELGGHKAAAIGLVMKKCTVYLVSDMDEGFVRSMFFEPFRDLQTALRHAMEARGEDALVTVMPYGGSTLPVIKKGGNNDRTLY